MVSGTFVLDCSETGQPLLKLSSYTTTTANTPVGNPHRVNLNGIVDSVNFSIIPHWSFIVTSTLGLQSIGDVNLFPLKRNEQQNRITCNFCIQNNNEYLVHRYHTKPSKSFTNNKAVTFKQFPKGCSQIPKGRHYLKHFWFKELTSAKLFKFISKNKYLNQIYNSIMTSFPSPIKNSSSNQVNYENSTTQTKKKPLKRNSSEQLIRGNLLGDKLASKDHTDGSRYSDSQIYPFSGTIPKTHRDVSADRSSSDDALYQPNKTKVKYKRQLPLDLSKFEANRTSTDSEKPTFEGREPKVVSRYKTRSSRTKKKVLSDSRSSSSSRSRSGSRQKVLKIQGIYARSRSHSGSPKSTCIQERPSQSVQPMNNTNSEEISGDGFRHQSQNTEMMGLNKSFSTIENEVFLKRVEEVLTDIVEQKKMKILQKTQMVASYSTYSVHSLESEQKVKRKPVGRWVLSRHYDTNERVKSSFSHIITSHGEAKLRYRSQSTDLLETHRRCFTKLEPYKPRILRKDAETKLIGDKNYQPPRNRKNFRRIDFEKQIRLSQHANVKNTKKSVPEIPSSSGKSSKNETADENQQTNTSNTEADDTCYESEHGGSDVALDWKQPTNTSTQQALEQAEASVDSAYTGSREPTPDDQTDLRIKALKYKLQHKDKHEQQTKQIIEELSLDDSFKTASDKFDNEEPIVERIKREIIIEIKDIGIHSNYAIETLLELYRRKYKHVSRSEFDTISGYIHDRIGMPESVNAETKKSFKSEESPKKGKVKFIPGDFDVRKTEATTNQEKSSQQHEIIYAEEVKQLSQVLHRSKNEKDSVRWLSTEEVAEARWAGRVLADCGILKDTSKVLDTATTWEDVSQALGIISSSPIHCGHENTDEERDNNSNSNPYDTQKLLDEIKLLSESKSYDTQSVRKRCGLSEQTNEMNLTVTNHNNSHKEVHFENGQATKLEKNNINDISKECLNRNPTNYLKDRSRYLDETVIRTTSTCKQINDTEQYADSTSMTISNEFSLDQKESLRSHEINDNACANPIKSNSNQPVRSFKKDEVEFCDDDFYDKEKSSAKPIKITNNFLQVPNVNFGNSNMSTDDEKNKIYRTENLVSSDPITHVDSENIRKSKISSDDDAEKDIKINREGLDVYNATDIESAESLQNFSDSQKIIVFQNDFKGKSTANKPESRAMSYQNNNEEPLSSVLNESTIPVLKQNIFKEQALNSNVHVSTVKFHEELREVNKTRTPVGSVILAGETQGSSSISSDIARDLEGVDKGSAGISVGVSPTQPSLKGKIAALAAAYTRKRDETPEWLRVADEVCKQFNISL